VPQTSILLVEDNREEADILREAFAGVDANLQLVVSGQVSAAWALLMALPNDHLPGLVITDHHLPDGCGQDLLVRLHDCPTHRHLPVVMLSGDSQRPVDLGAIRWFGKPDTWAGWCQLAQVLASQVAGR
jgi:CheY-like chemotaxis protein